MYRQTLQYGANVRILEPQWMADQLIREHTQALHNHSQPSPLANHHPSPHPEPQPDIDEALEHTSTSN